MSNLIKACIDKRLSNMTMSEVSSNKIFERIFVLKKNQMRNKRVLRTLAVTFIVCVCFLFSVTALAATVPEINDLLYMVSPQAAMFLQPVNKSAEDNDIKMQVLAAMQDGTTAVAYISLQDLTGNRIDESIDLYDFEIKGLSTYHSEVVSYDADTDTAVIRLLGTGNGGKEIDCEKITVSVTTILSNKNNYPDYKTEIDLADLASDNPKYSSLVNYGYSGGGGILYDQVINDEKMNVLLPDQMSVSMGKDIDFVTISNAGFVDGYLHIQTKWLPSVDNHGDIYIYDNKGNRVESANFYFSKDNNYETGILKEKYIEYVFDISDKKDLNDCTLWAFFVEDGDCIRGNWSVTFSIDSMEDSKLCFTDLDFADSLEVTPIGINMKNCVLSEDGVALEVKMKDDSLIEFSAIISWAEDDISELIFLSDSTIDVKKISEIIINGNKIYG